MKNSTIQLLVKVIAIALLVMTIASFSTTVNAVKGTGITANVLEDNIDVGSGDATLVQKIGKIMGTIRNVAIIASVIVLMVIGVKYILGSVEEKAEYKKSFMPLIIGIVLVVMATSIASFIFNVIG